MSTNGLSVCCPHCQAPVLLDETTASTGWDCPHCGAAVSGQDESEPAAAPDEAKRQRQEEAMQAENTRALWRYTAIASLISGSIIIGGALLFRAAFTTSDDTHATPAAAQVRQVKAGDARHDRDPVKIVQMTRPPVEATAPAMTEADPKATPAADEARKREEQRRLEEARTAEATRKAGEDSRRAAEKTQQTEQAATAKLGLIKIQIADGKVEKAKVRLQDLIERFPKTKASEEASRILSTMKP